MTCVFDCNWCLVLDKVVGTAWGEAVTYVGLAAASALINIVGPLLKSHSRRDKRDEGLPGCGSGGLLGGLARSLLAGHLCTLVTWCSLVLCSHLSLVRGR